MQVLTKKTYFMLDVHRVKDPRNMHEIFTKMGLNWLIIRCRMCILSFIKTGLMGGKSWILSFAVFFRDFFDKICRFSSELVRFPVQIGIQVKLVGVSLMKREEILIL